jgi:hypothetical protein
MQAGLTGVRVLRKSGVLDHGDDRLAQHPFVAADDGLRGTASCRIGCPFQHLTGQGVQ